MRRWAPFGILLVALGLLAGRWLSSDRVPDAGPRQAPAASGEGPERTALAAYPRDPTAAARGLLRRPRILGQVLEEGRPVRARVELLPLSPEIDDVWPAEWGSRRPMAAGGQPRPVAVRDADDEGRFAFEDVSAARFVVVARAGSGARGWSLADTRPAKRGEAGAHVDVHVRGWLGRPHVRDQRRRVRVDALPVRQHLHRRHGVIPVRLRGRLCRRAVQHQHRRVCVDALRERRHVCRRSCGVDVRVRGWLGRSYVRDQRRRVRVDALRKWCVC